MYVFISVFVCFNRDDNIMYVFMSVFVCINIDRLILSTLSMSVFVSFNGDDIMDDIYNTVFVCFNREHIMYVYKIKCLYVSTEMIILCMCLCQSLYVSTEIDQYDVRCLCQCMYVSTYSILCMCLFQRLYVSTRDDIMYVFMSVNLGSQPVIWFAGSIIRQF